MSLPASFFNGLFVFFFGYYLLLVTFSVFQGVNGIFESRRRSRQKSVENYTEQYLSPLIISVTVIIPAHNEELWIRDSLLSVINLNYPKFDVIVVDDGSTDGTFAILEELLELRQADVYYVRHHKDAQIKTLYRSARHPNVTVLRKDSGKKKAGALNAGLNIAEGQYICVMDADTVLEPNALSDIMLHVGRDPDRIIGAESYFGLANGFGIRDGKIVRRHFSLKPLIAYQNLEYIRSFIGNRVAWSRYNVLPIVAGGFGVWRRDVLYDFGGYSTEFTCEDLELTFKAREYIANNRDKDYRILSLPYCVGWTEGPGDVRSLVSQRERWQRVVNEVIWKYKYMLFNPRYGLFGFLAVPYYVFYEVGGVFIELASLATAVWGWLAGLMSLKVFLAFTILMVMTQVFISVIAVFAFVVSQRVLTVRYALYLIVLAFLEFFMYRWLLCAAKIQGCVNSVRGMRSFNQYTRSKR
ncbi:MAG: glycosyltransferase [Candidatus Omnitrophota bacterium]